MSRFNDGNEVLRRLEAAKNGAYGSTGSTGSQANATADMSDADKQSVAELRKLIAGRRSSGAGTGSHTAIAPAATTQATSAPAATTQATSAPAATTQEATAQVSQPSEQGQTSASVQNGSLFDRIQNMIKDKDEKAQADKQASALPEIERRVDFYEKSPMGNIGTPAAADIGKGAAVLPTSMQSKIVQSGDKVLSEKSEEVDKAVSDAEASRREIASAQRLMSDTIGIYGATKDENGAVVFQTQEGLNRYLSAEQRYNDAVQQYIDSTGEIYKSADEFSDAYQVYSDSMNALFQTFRDMPDSKILGLAKVGNVAAQQYLMAYTNRGIVQRPLSYFTKNIDAAIADGNLERADELTNWMVSQPWSAEDADAAVAYIDKTFNSSNLYSNGAKNVKGFAEASYIVDLADRSQWETLYNLMNSPEGDKYKEVIKNVYGIDCDSEESKRDNYLGLAEQLRPKIEAYISGDNKYEFDMLSKSAEYYKTRVANNRFVSRAEDEITRASKSATYRTQMDSYMRSQTAYYILNEISNQLSAEDAGINMSVVKDSNTTKYLIEYLRDACGVDIAGMNEENYRQVISAAMAEQSKKARVMGGVLKRAGFDIDVVRQYAELGVQYGYENVRQKDLQEWSKNAKWYEWIGVNIAMLPAKVLMKPFTAVEMLSLYGPDSDVSDPNSYVPVVASPSGIDMLQSETGKTIEEHTDWELFGRNVASFLYTTTMSGLESTASALLFGKWSVLFMGASAASSEADNIIARGGNRRQAFWGGLAAGAVEVATEYFSVDMFLKNCGTATGFKSFWEKAGEQFFTEGSEEAVGGVLDLVFDATNMGNLSESSQAVKAYMEQGLSYDDARIEVVYDNIADILEASFSGGLSGAGSSGFSNIVSAYTNAKTINQQIDSYMSDDNVLSLYAKISAGIQDGDSEAVQRRKLRKWISETEFSGRTAEERENARLHEQKRFEFETAKAAAKIAAQETEQRAALVQEANPEATVLTSNGAQAYLDTGVVTLKVAQDAGEVLDGIVAGEITSDSISNKKIDRLKTTQEFGRKAVSSVLGVEVKRASTASLQRAAVREAIRTFEQNNAEAQSAVATAQNQAQQGETALGMEFDEQNSIPAMMQQNAVDSVGMPTMQQTAPATATQQTAPETGVVGGTVGNARSVSQAQASAQNGKVSTGQVESNTEMSDATGAVANVHGDANTTPMSYKEFKYRMKNDKGFRNRYAPSNKNLSEEERNTIAYDTYLTQEQAKTNSDRADTVQHSVKDNQYGVERNEYSEKLDQKVVSAIDALAKLFHLKVRFGDLGGNNGLYHADTGLIELDIDPQHSGASNGFLFSVAHEIGHAVKARIGAKAWEEFADYAVKAKNGEKTIKAKQKSAAEYAEYAVAREEVVCDFIGELLSEQKVLDTFCESIKGGEIKAETARGIVAAWRKITGILRGKGVKQTDTATAALVQRVQEQFGTDIETAENAVRKMQKALSAAMKVETQNKNAAETGDDIRHSLKDAMKIGFDKLIKQFFGKKISRANPIFISNAPKNAEAMFKTNVPFIISSSDMTKSTRENNGSSRSAHALSRTFIEHLPQNIEESVIGYLENRNGVNSFTFVCFDEESNSLVAVGGALNVLYEGQTVNRVLSIFHISTPESFLTKSGKDLVTTDIEKAKNILEKARIQSPALQDILDSARIVTQTNSESQEKNQKNNVDGDTLHSKKDKPRRIVPTPEEAKELDERLKAREEEKAAQKRKERDEMLKRLVYTSPGFAPYSSVKDNLSSMADQYGRIPQGESPARDVTVPVSTDGETKVSRTVRTAMEAEATPKEIIPHIEESIVEGNFNYKPKKNAKTMEAAREWVEQRGDVTKAYEDWISEKNRRLNADMIARGFIIYNNLSNAYVNAKTETERTALREKAISILQDISVMGTVAGQTAQAIRLLKQQSPESQYYALERSVRKLQDGINERYGDKRNDAPKIEIDKERAAKWIQALREGDMELAYDLEEVLFQQIAKQIPKTLSDRLNAWRYLSMLGNPKTLIRNAFGNAAFTPVTMAKDQIGALMEKLLPKEQRTKYFGSLHASKEGRALLKFASEDALSSDVQQMMERNKYDDTNVNDRIARAVSERRRTFDAPVLKQWQAATRYMMEKMPGMGDEFYKGIHYRRAFAGAAMARGYTVSDFTSGRVSETELIKLRTYATNQAMKATFNDANKFSDLVRRIHTKSKVVNTAIEGTLPFKRTPANVAVRSFEYSPLAMIRSLTTDLYALKTGKITGQEYIEHLAQGVTGTVMFGLGWLAAATGIVRVGADDDDEREGRQNYSLELFGESITLDWLAPTSVAFFMGAETRELFSERDIGESFLDAAIDSGSNIFAPVLEMTALSGAKDLLDTFVYSYNKDGADAGQIVQALFVQPFLSYLGQFAPTIFGQFENMFEPYRTTTYVGDIQGKVDRTFVRNIAKILEKIPFVDWRQIEYVDDWGRKDYNGNAFLRFFNSFINPAYVNDIVVTDVDTEVRRIKQSTGTNVSPKRRGYSVTVTDYDENGDEISSEEVTLSAEQFEAYQTEYGKQYALMSASLMASTYYDTLSDKEKAKAFKEIESLADEYGKIAAGVGYVLDKSSTDNKLYELIEAGMPVAEAYAARLMYTQLSKDEELTPVERYEKFRVWVYGNDEWTDSEKAAVIERFGKFSSGFVAKSDNFDEMIESGIIDADVSNSINSGIRNLEPEDGKDQASVYQKYDYILSRKDLSPSQKDAAIIAYMGDQEEARFKPCAESGVSATNYANVALRIHNLKPTGGRTNVNDGQKWEVCVNSVSSVKQQDALLNRYMDKDQSAKYKQARSAGVSPSLYVKYYNAKYTYGDGNGSWNQNELQHWLDENVSSRSQKATLWELTNSSWKTNPYK